MKKLLAGIFVVLLLQGCAPAAFVAGAAAGGSVIYDNRSTNAMLMDHDITYTAENKISADVQLKESASISVATFNGIVLLTGQAPTPALRTKAESLVKSVPHIRLVYNEITIEKPISNVAEANDAWITSKVKTVLFAERNLNSTQLKIVTENGVVYLMGLTTRSQAQLATDRTRTVTGVRKVVKLFEYIS